MKRKMIPITLLGVLLLWLAGCNLPIVVQVQQAPSPVDMTAAILTGVAGTMVFQTSVAGTLMAGQPGGGSPPVEGASPAAPSGPTFTPSPTFTLAPTLTLTPSKPMLTVSQNTYCRTGPGSEYELVTTVNVGEQAEVIARDPYNTSWYIRNPDNPYGFCWVWGQYATVTGDTGAIPVFTPPPTPKPTLTPTPTSDFTLSYKLVANCGALYAPTFSITNTGGVTWESIHIVVTDTVTAIAKSHVADTFDEYNGCVLFLSQGDLTTGEAGNVTTTTNPFNYVLTGHAMTATIKLCSQNGLGGTCLSKTINFTP